MEVTKRNDRKLLVFLLVACQIAIILIFGNTFVNFNSYRKYHSYRAKHKSGSSSAYIAENVRDQQNTVQVSMSKSEVKSGQQEIEKVEISQVSKSLVKKDPLKGANIKAGEVNRGEDITPQAKLISDIYLKVQNNSVFKNFRITSRAKRMVTNLLLIVSSAPKRSDRRNAIRETWWPLCKSTDKVKVTCIFMTDQQGKDSQYAQQLKEETEKYKDLEFQDLGGGVEFGKRFLYHMLWAVRNFEFDYFMRMDDDYFLCLDKLINELPMPPLSMFHWGWVHCINQITRPEESIIIFSKDVIQLFLLQNPETMRCHPWADQQIGLWVEDLELKQTLFYRTDRRLHHDPPTQSLPHLVAEENICQARLGLHGSYPATMRTLWQHRGTYDLKKETLLDNSDICKSNLNFRWSDFTGFWRYEPTLCKTDPKWDTSKQGSGKSFGGREEGLGK